MPCCSIITCRKRSQDCNIAKGNISYYRFPSDPKLKEKWVLATGRGNWMPTKSSTICSTHFNDSDFELKKSGYRYLKVGAVPHRNVVTVITCMPETSRSGARNTSINLKETGKEIEECHTVRNSVDKPAAEQVEDIPEGKMIIARVYRYFKDEYEILKAFTGNHWEINPLANYLQRTAEATGVSVQAVTMIVEDKRYFLESQHVADQEKSNEKEPEVDINNEGNKDQNSAEEKIVNKDLSPTSLNERRSPLIDMSAEGIKLKVEHMDEEEPQFPSPIQLRVLGAMETEYKTEPADDECSPTLGNYPLETGDLVDHENDAATITKIKKESDDDTEMLNMEQSINTMICDALQTSEATIHVKAEPSSPAD